MKNALIIVTGIVSVIFMISTTRAEDTRHPPMPPSFDTHADPQQALAKYPLGVISKQAAFSHHGKADRTVTLPNGDEGWVYQVGSGFGLRTYTLVFDSRGVVVDVLYNEKGRHNGLTAVQVQAQDARILGPAAEPQPYKKERPESFRYGQ